MLVASRDARRSEVQYINGVCKRPRREGANSTDKNIYAPLLSASTPFSGRACVGGTWARSRARERCAPCLRRQGGATHGAPYDAISFIHRSIGFSCSSVEAKRNQTRRDRAEGEVREEEGKKEREKQTNKQTNKQRNKRKTQKNLTHHSHRAAPDKSTRDPGSASMVVGRPGASACGANSNIAGASSLQ